MGASTAAGGTAMTTSAISATQGPSCLKPALCQVTPASATQPPRQQLHQSQS